MEEGTADREQEAHLCSYSVRTEDVCDFRGCPVTVGHMLKDREVEESPWPTPNAS